ncbi:MAG TPA: DMT family transporter [Gaiellaceae bacterium]|nr:DMT family transporter [Gaiellaceae bacterium]
MTRAYVPLVATLSLLWGSSYLFIKVAGRELQPSTMMLIRVIVAGAALIVFLAAQGGLGELRQAPRGAYLLGLFNSAIPFTLIAWGERHIDSGLAAVANASVPIFAGLLAVRWRPSERPRGIRAVGVGLGLVGVVVLTGVAPGGGWWGVAGVLAVTLASLSYGVSALYGQHLVGHVRGPVLSTAALAGALVVLLPFGIAQAPSHMPSWKAIGCVLALALLGTAFAQLLWFRMLGRFGAARSTLVSYLIPATALVYGVVFLSEHVSVAELVGFFLILAGVALGSGARLPRRGVEAVQHP